jgi:uncharacterized membrane protein (UPF0127 family)
MKIYINDIEFPLTILQNKFELNKGLKRKTSEDINGCYYFMLTDGKIHSFWMKDCLVDLDIVFCDNNKITKIFHNCPPCTEEDCKHYQHEGNGVLEFLGGTCESHGITEGDTFTIDF